MRDFGPKSLASASQRAHVAGVRKRWQIAVGVMLLALVGTCGWQVLAVREPSYDGRALSEWLADLGPGGARSGDEAVRAVRAMGTNSIPWLTKMLRFRDPVWKQVVLALNARQSVVRLPVTSASTFRARAMQGFIAMGGRARDSVPTLVRMMDLETSPQVRSCIVGALGGIGPDAKAAIPVLARTAQDGNPQLRQEATLALANIRAWVPDDHGL